MGYEVVQFPISDDNLMKFRRWVKKPNDCAINALQIIGEIDEIEAELLRIAVGDMGLTKTQIENTLNYLQPNYHWHFYEYTNILTLAQFTRNEMSPNTVIFCGYMVWNPYLRREFGHVFLIGKKTDGSVLYIDPQIPIVCDLDNDVCYTPNCQLYPSQCLNYIANKNRYFILQKTRK